MAIIGHPPRYKIQWKILYKFQTIAKVKPQNQKSIQNIKIDKTHKSHVLIDIINNHI